MKAVSIVIFAFLSTVVLSTSLPDGKIHVHYHLDQPIKADRASGIVSRLINSTIHKENPKIEYHLHFEELLSDSDDQVQIEDLDIGGIIQKAKEGFEKVKHKIASIHLPHISLPELKQTIIDLSKVASHLLGCAQVLQKVIPNMILFAKAAATSNSVEAVDQILKILTYMPDISSKCLGQNFDIPKNIMDEIQCATDIAALAGRIGQFVLAPTTIISNLGGLKDMIDLIPKTTSDCTGAFN